RHRGVVGGGGIRRARALPLHVVAVGLGGRSRGARERAGAAAAGRTGRGGHVAGRGRGGDGVQAGGGIIGPRLRLRIRNRVHGGGALQRRVLLGLRRGLRRLRGRAGVGLERHRDRL